MSVVYSVCAHLPVKQEVRVQIPSVTLKICRRGSTEKGTALVKRLMLVQIQSSALNFFVLGVCRIRTRLCGGRRPGSIPGEDA